MKDIPITTFQIISYFLPGFVFVLFCFIAFDDILSFHQLLNSFKELSSGIFVAAIIISFIIGVIMDGIRNGFIEDRFDKLDSKKTSKEKMNWDFFFQGSKEDVGLLYARYYTYYCFDLNMSISIILSATILLVFTSMNYVLIIVISLAIVGILVKDAISLRKEITKFSHKNSPYIANF